MKEAQALGWPSDVATRAESGEVVLAHRCADGDQDACRALVEEHRRMVFALGFQLLGDHDEALDLSQEVFLRVFRTIGRFEGRATLRTWIYRIVVNGARNRQRWFRRHRRSLQVPLDVHVDANGEPPATPAVSSPELAYDRKLVRGQLWGALAELPLEQRSALVPRELHGMRYSEIAFSLGISTSAVKSRLSRARQALRRELTP